MFIPHSDTMTRFTKILILCLILVSVLSCGIKLPVSGESVNTAVPYSHETDDALFSLRDVPTVTPPAPVLEGGTRFLKETP